MCQQKVLTRYSDPRYAVTMTAVQTAIARGKAGTIDVLSTPLELNERQLGVKTEVLRNFVSVPLPGTVRLILFRSPVVEDASIFALRLALTQFGHSPVALVAGDLAKSQGTVHIRILAWNHMGDIPIAQNSNSINSGDFSKLVFNDMSHSWWTVRRHIEATVTPPVHIKKDEIWGLYFAEDLPTISTIRDPSLPNSMIVTKKFTSTLGDFNSLLQAGGFDVPKNEFISGGPPVMNIVVR